MGVDSEPRPPPRKKKIPKYAPDNMISIYMLCLSVCPFLSKKRQNGWTDQAQILCGSSHVLRPSDKD